MAKKALKKKRLTLTQQLAAARRQARSLNLMIDGLQWEVADLKRTMSQKDRHLDDMWLQVEGMTKTVDAVRKLALRIDAEATEKALAGMQLAFRIRQ